MVEIVLTADGSAMSSYNDNIYMGFMSCLPENICPGFLYKMLVPPIEANLDGTAKTPTLSLRTVEAICANSFGREKVKIAHQNYLSKVIDETTKIVGVSTHDPLGTAPATTTWSSIFGGVPHNRIQFLRLMEEIKSLRRKYDFKIVAGGPGAWQLANGDRMEQLGIDHLVLGEGEIAVPKLFDSILNGEDAERKVMDRIPDGNEIPPILGPSNCRLVEITRGCGRGCSFCAPNTSGRLRSLPMEKILADVRTYLNHGIDRITFQSDDSLRYGSKNLLADKDALLNLYQDCFDAGARGLFMTHASLVNFAHQPEVIEALTKLLNKHGIKYYGCQPGLETGSRRLIQRYMHGKVYPRDPEEWQEVVLEAFKVMKKYNWYAVCTLICGLPEENLDDVKMTIDLIKKLEGYPSLYIPLFFVPMSMTSLRDRNAFVMNNMTTTHWELMLACWDHNLKHLYKLYTMVSKDHSPIFKFVVKSLILTLKVWMEMKREEALKGKIVAYSG